MSGAYADIDDWDGWRLSRSTTIVQLGQAEGLRLGLTDRAADLDDSYRRLALAIADVSTATPDILSRLATRWGVSVSGLSLRESRLVVAAARLASRSSGTPGDVFAAWLALTGGDVDRCRIDTLTAGTILLQAEVDIQPSAPWLVRGRQVMARAIPAGYELTAIIGTPATARYDESRYDDARYGWSFSVVR